VLPFSSLRWARAAAAAVLLVGLSPACSTYRSELHRGQRYYEENKYEAALALWRALEPNQDSLSDGERVRYAYFRGMTDYRLGYRADARYWLSLAQAGEGLHPASLPLESRQRLEDTLQELNGDLRAAGAKPPAAAGAGTEPPADSAAGGPVVPTDPAGTPCRWSSECPRGYVCQDRVCVEL
jgi:hypothetical protein